MSAQFSGPALARCSWPALQERWWKISLAPLVCAALLGGCKTFSPDGGMDTVAAIAGQGLNKDVVQVRSAEDAAVAHDAVARLLQRQLTGDAAVQIALLNNLGLQAAYNRLGIAEAVMVQASRPPVPTFSISRVSTSLELDIERQIVGSILALATLPARSEIAADRFEQAQLRAAEETLRVAAATRRAYYRAVAARQIVTALTETKASAQSSAELAAQLQQTGALNQLEQARRQVFATEVEAQLMGARQQAAATREQLTRLMGLLHSNLDAQLPSTLPPLPKGVRTLASVEQEAMDRRVDLQIAQIEMEALARSYGLTRKTHFINVLDVSGMSKTQKNTGESGADGGGIGVAFQVPLFDFGKANVREAEQRYLEAVNSLGEKAVNARSEAREAYGAYKATRDIVAQYEGKVLPLRQTISEATELQYSAMQVDAFAVLAEARARAAAKVASIEAKRNFWLASTDLSVAVLGGGSIATESGSLLSPTGGEVASQ
jgi:outer membrane protein TolC